jgi:hypothetical protein
MRIKVMTQRLFSGTRPFGGRIVVVAAVAATLPALLATGCGGTDAGGAHQAGIAAADAAVVPMAGGGVSATGTARAKADPVSQHPKVQVARRQSGQVDDESNETGAKPQKPCTLVTRAEAAAILHRRIARMTTGAQGPTCIYQPAGGGRVVTLAVQSADFAAIRRQGHLVSSRGVGGHRAYCIRLGSETTYVPLSGHRVLTITASCPVGARFAARALRRI